MNTHVVLLIQSYVYSCIAVAGIGLDTLPEGLEELLDITEENSPTYLRAKKKLEEYLPFETELVRVYNVRHVTYR